MRGYNSSMQLTRAADYGVRVMIHLLAEGAPPRASLGALAQATETPESFLSKVLQALTKGGLLVSQRGQTGGFELSSRGRLSSMRDVIEAVDGPIHLNVCLTAGKTCSRAAWCPAHPVWVEAQKALLDVLQTARIDDMARGLDAGSQRLQSRTSTAPAIASLPVEPPAQCSCGRVNEVI